MRLVWILAAFALGLAACGGDEPERAEKPSAPRGEQPTRAEIEEFGKVKLPASTRDVQARMSHGIDTGLFLRFEIDRDDVDAFVRDGNFDAQAGFRPSYPYTEEGWRLDRIRNTLGAEELKGSFGRELVIDLDRPDVATVYLVATTV
jgi:hypothetical protein